MHQTQHSLQCGANLSNLIHIPCLSSQNNLSAPLSTSSNQLPDFPLNNMLAFGSRKGLGLVHWNIRSLVSPMKLDHVNLLVAQADPDILVLSETWLKGDIKDSEVALNGFNINRIDRASRGGGVAVYTKACLTSHTLYSVSVKNSFEFIALKVIYGQNNNALVIIGIYRPPSAPVKALDQLAELLSIYADTETIILGDFNIDWSSAASGRMKEVAASLNFTQLISEPTRPNLLNPSKSTTIDLIFSNRPDKVTNTWVFDLGVSDHCPTACTRDSHIKKAPPHIVTKRSLRHFSEQAFINDLYTSNIHSTTDMPNVDLALDCFISNFNAIANTHAPFKKFRVKDRTNPWFTTELSTMLIVRNKAWALARRTKAASDWTYFRQIRNKFTAAVRQAKSNYNIDMLSSSSSNPKIFWKAFKSFNGNSSPTPTSVMSEDCRLVDSNDICSAFNKHFSVAGLIFDDHLSEQSNRNFISESPCSFNGDHIVPLDSAVHFSLSPFTTSEVLGALSNMNSRCSTGEDNLDPFLLKLSAPYIAEEITYIFNLSISSATFPQLWKMAHVSPLHKSGAKDDLNNYRPISKLPCLSKILESLTNNQLKAFLSRHSILATHQSGFRAQHSTITAATLVLNDIVSALDRKEHCAALFVDLTKAFDTVDHALLLHKLMDIGFDSNASNWFKSYLSNRFQCVKAGVAKSDFLPLRKGVPQGSVLGPILFTIFINDIVSSLSSSRVHLYADDTILYCTANTITLAIDSLQQAFNTLQKSLFNLKLVLNPNKTKFMLFSKAKGIKSGAFHLTTLTGCDIEQVPVYKYLGIWIDENLNFSFHIDCLAKQLRQKMGFLYRHKSSLPLSCRKRIIESVILPVLDYGDIIYKNATISSLSMLDSIYHSAIRFSTGSAYNTHHCILYDTIGWPSLTERRFRHWILFIYKAILGKLPSYISSLLNWHSSMHHTRSSSQLLLSVPSVRTELGKSAFCFDAPRSWNLIQRTFNLESLISFNQFKILITNLPNPVCNCYR